MIWEFIQDTGCHGCIDNAIHLAAVLEKGIRNIAIGTVSEFLEEHEENITELFLMYLKNLTEKFIRKD